MNPGHGDYDKRMEFVKFVLSQFGLEVAVLLYPVHRSCVDE
jgi:hypothetical protein